MPYLQLGRSHSCRPLCVILAEVELKTSVTCLNIRMQRECVHTDKQGLCVICDPFLCSVNQLYAELDELGSLDDSWREVCSNLRALSTQTACTDISTRWLGCRNQG